MVFVDKWTSAVEWHRSSELRDIKEPRGLPGALATQESLQGVQIDPKVSLESFSEVVSTKISQQSYLNQVISTKISQPSDLIQGISTRISHPNGLSQVISTKISQPSDLN